MRDRIYLYVPFEEKAEAKALGARWDSDCKCWYIERGQDRTRFRRWMEDGIEDGVGKGRDAQREYAILSERAYVGRAKTRCWRCRSSIEVICIYCETGRIDGEAYDAFTVSNITAIDDALQRQLGRWPHFRFGYSSSEGRRYLANHCPRCRALQADYYLHCEPDGAFFTLKAAPEGSVAFEPLAGRVSLRGDQGFEP